MGGSQSRPQQSRNKGARDLHVLVERMVADPQTPTPELLKLRNTVFAQKSAINKSQDQALRVVLDSIGRTQKAEDSYQKLTKAIQARTNATRRKVSNTQK